MQGNRENSKGSHNEESVSSTLGKEQTGQGKSNIIENIKVDKNKKIIYLYDVAITEDELEELLKSKRKEQKNETCNYKKVCYNYEMNGKNVEHNNVVEEKGTLCNSNVDSKCSWIDDNHKVISLMRCQKYIIENRINKDIDIPHNNTINALFMDYYHLVMAYTYFKQNKHEDKSIFEVYFRKCPFNGQFAILAGVYEVIKYINCFRFTKAQLDFIRKKMSSYNDIDSFVQYLEKISGNDLCIYGMEEGSVVFPNEPLMVIEGPLLICQILESVILNLMNYPTLISTNSIMYKFSINNKTLAEFGCRRAQGPDGALSGSKYSFCGCDFTSNVYASYLYDIPILGTMSHSFISSFHNTEKLISNLLDNHDFVSIINKNKNIVHKLYDCKYTNESELIAFSAFAQINPKNFICLIDTYDTLKSGIYNFLIVALSLYEINYKPIGIRIDSGDLRSLTNECKNIFNDISQKLNVPFNQLKICVSNDINEKIINYLNEEQNHIDIFAIGTNLITCQSQPSLGLVYKLVQINNAPCFKMTNENKKSNLPYQKNVYRIYTDQQFATLDYIQLYNEQPPILNQQTISINIHDEWKQTIIIPKKIEQKLCLIWKYGKSLITFKNIYDLKKYTQSEINNFKNEHFKTVSPVPYPVLFSDTYHKVYKDLLIKNSHINQ